MLEQFVQNNIQLKIRINLYNNNTHHYIKENTNIL